MEIYNLVSFCGIFILIGLAWLFSTNKRNMNWRAVIWGVILQLLFAGFIFLIPAGSRLFLWANGLVIKVLNSASAGARFIFGRLAVAPGEVSSNGEASLGFFLAFQAFPTIIFFSSLMSILYYFNIMPRIIRAFAYVFTRLMRVSGAESLVAASNIFMGIESCLTVKPHLSEMTRSELCTVLTAGMATVSSNVMAIYVYSLKAQFPSIAGHLISASILSAPAAILISKVILPEEEKPKTLGRTIQFHYEKEKNLFEAIINGANTGVKMIARIVALLIAVLGLVALFDMSLTALGSRVNLFLGIHFDWSLKSILGYIFYPFTVILGVPLSDAGVISKIIGERAVLTEVVAYQNLAIAMGKNLLHNPRSAVIAAYALCGFAHLASMAIFVGGVSALAPNKTRTLTQAAFPALLAATLACLLTACIAGAFITKGSILLG